MRQDVTLDGNQLVQPEDVAFLITVVLDSAKDTIPKMVLRLHGTTLTGKGAVGRLQRRHSQQTSG